MRFLLSGYYGFGNLGDEALLAIIVEQLRRRWPTAMIEVLSATPEATRAEYDVDATQRHDLLAVRQAIRRSTCLLSGGGGLLQNTTSLRSLLYYAGMLHVAARAALPTCIFAQSIGPLDACGRRVVARLCRSVGLATVRDTASERLLRELLPQLRIERTADPVFLMRSPSSEEREAPLGLRSESGPLAFISVRRSKQSEQVVERVVRAVDHLATRWGIRSVFVPLGGASDAEVATAVIRKSTSRPLLLPGGDLATTAALIARCDVVIGMRLHALILAAAAHVPFLSLSYDPKVTALTDDLEYPLPPLWHSDPSMTTEASPEALVDRLCSERTALTATLAAGHRRMQAAAERNFTLLEEFLGHDGSFNHR